MSGTPSRVTRSASRQPERAPSSGSSKKKSASSSSTGSHKKSANGGSAKKKSTSSSSASSDASTPRTSSGSGSTKKSSSSASAKAAAAADDAAESPVENGVEQRVSRAKSRVEAPAAANFSFDAPRASSSASSYSSRKQAAADGEVMGPQRKPLVALLPHVALYAAMVFVAHLLVLYAWAKPKSALQTAIISHLSCGSCGLMDQATLKNLLDMSDKHHIGLFVLVPLYLGAGYLLRQGVLDIVGKQQGRAQALAMNLARTISVLAFACTIYAYTKWDRRDSLEGLNALVVLQFAFMLQEWLLNFSRFSNARMLYSLVYIALMGWLSVEAYWYDAGTLKPAQATGDLMALNYAFLVVNTSDNVWAAAGVAQAFGLTTLATMFMATQSVVNVAVAAVMAAALFQQNPQLFPAVAAPGVTAATASPSFAEAAGAALTMIGLVFLLIIDGFIVSFSRLREGRIKTA